MRKTITDAHANWRGRGNPFKGVYSSFDEFTTTSLSAEQDQVTAAVAAALESVQLLKLPGLVEMRRARVLLPAVAAMLGSGPLKILDFGGAAGADFGHLLCAMGADVDVQYTVVDLPAVCEAGRAIWANDKRISFASELPLPEARFDLIYSWGAIQYLNDVPALLKSFVEYSPRAILIVGSPFAERSFVRMQTNQSVGYPQWVISLPETEKIMLDAGYSLKCRLATGENYDVDNYPEEYRVPDYAALLFVSPNIDSPATSENSNDVVSSIV